MSGPRRRAALTGAGIAGLVVGAALAFLATDLAADDPNGSDPTTTPSTAGGDGLEETDSAATPAPTSEPTTTSTVATDADVLLAWTSGGLPPGFSSGAAGLTGVERLTVVQGGQADLLSSRAPDDSPVETVASGWAIPLDTIAVDPATFGAFTSDARDRRLIEGLEPGEALLTSSSTELRRVGVGATLELEGGAVLVAGIVSDQSGAAAELIIHVSDAVRFDVAVERYVLVAHAPDARTALNEALADLARPRSVRFRTPAETTWLRHGDGVVPLVYVKLAFGEFHYRDLTGRAVEIDPTWVEANIVTATVPLLGEVRCNRAMIAPLTAVLGELAASNLGHLVDPDTFAGCWVPRRIGAGFPLSKHTWGIAVDVNIGTNPRGSFSTQDPRLVDLMRSAGFTWGGTWLVPDPGHYELDP